MGAGNLPQQLWAGTFEGSEYHEQHAYALANMGDVGRSIDYFTQAIASAEAAVGSEHAIIATMRTNLGIALRLNGQADAARAELERAAVIGQSSLGPYHLDVARSMANLGALHFEQSEFQLAQQYLEKALNIFEHALGPDHPLLCGRLNDLGRCMQALGYADASAAFYERSARILQRNQTVSAAEEVAVQPV